MHPFIKSSAVLAVFLLANKVLGFFEKILVANYFGTSSDADVFIVAQTLFVSGWVFVEEIAVPSLVPVLAAISGQDGRRTREALTQKAIVALIPVIVAFAGLTLAGHDAVASLLFPGFDAAARARMSSLWVYFCIAMIPFYLTPVLQAYANSRKMFFPSALASVLGRLAMIGCFVAGVRSLGLTGAGIGMIAYGLIFFVILAALIRFPVRLAVRPFLQVGPEEKTAFRLAIPLVLGFAFSQACQWVDMRYGSMLAQGTVASLAFSRKLIDVPVLVVSFCVGTVLLPYLAGFARERDFRRFEKYVTRSLVLCFVVYGVAMIPFIGFADWIVTIVYARGKFDQASVHATATLLKFAAPGLLVFACEIIVMQASFAVRNHWPAIITGMICASLNIGATILLVPRFGAVVIPAAAVGQKALKTALMWVLLQNKIQSLRSTTATPV